jgi:hypothetical protein
MRLGEFSSKLSATERSTLFATVRPWPCRSRFPASKGGVCAGNVGNRFDEGSLSMKRRECLNFIRFALSLALVMFKLNSRLTCSVVVIIIGRTARHVGDQVF